MQFKIIPGEQLDYQKISSATRPEMVITMYLALILSIMMSAVSGWQFPLFSYGSVEIINIAVVMPAWCHILQWRRAIAAGALS